MGSANERARYGPMAEYADQRVSSIDPRSELCGGGRNGGGGWWDSVGRGRGV